MLTFGLHMCVHTPAFLLAQIHIHENVKMHTPPHPPHTCHLFMYLSSHLWFNGELLGKGRVERRRAVTVDRTAALTVWLIEG